MTDKATPSPEALVEALAAQWDGCEYDAPGGLIDIGDAIRRAGLPLANNLRAEVERLAAQAAPAETSAVVSAPKFTRLKFFRDLSNDERMRMLRVFMDLSTIPDDAIKTHGVQRQLFDRVFAVAQSAQAPAQAVQEARCACNDQPASECPGEWEPGCDLGNNPKYVRAYVDADRASSGATPAAQPTTLQAHTRAVGEWLSELYAVMVDPCADGQMTPQAMCEAIMAAALRARELAAATPADVRMLREALQGFVDFHTKPAGVTVEIITEKDIFLQAMADIDAREKKLVAAAIDVLAGGA